jgi:hypothetical protein
VEKPKYPRQLWTWRRRWMHKTAMSAYSKEVCWASEFAARCTKNGSTQCLAWEAEVACFKKLKFCMKSKLQIGIQELNLQILHWIQFMALIIFCGEWCVCVCVYMCIYINIYIYTHTPLTIKNYQYIYMRHAWPHEI